MSAFLLCVAAVGLILWASIEMQPPVRSLGAKRRKSERPNPLMRLGDAIVNVANARTDRDVGSLNRGERKILGACALSAVAMAVFAPLLAVAPMFVAPAYIWLRRRRALQQRRDAFLRELPVVIELFALLVRCGFNVNLALRETTMHLRGPLVAEFRTVLSEVEHGSRLADALDRLPARTCEELRPFVWCLTSTERYGAPLSDVLTRLSLDTRTLLENRAEESVRKLTVQLLFPLAGATLPAFALLTVAPFVVSSFRTVTSAFN